MKKAAPKKVDRVALMRSRGFIPAMEVSQKTGMNITTVYRWINDGKVKEQRVGRERYVELESLVNHLGLDVCSIFGIITKDQAAIFAKKPKKSASG